MSRGRIVGPRRPETPAVIYAPARDWPYGPAVGTDGADLWSARTVGARGSRGLSLKAVFVLW